MRIIVLFLDDYHVSRAGAMNIRGWLRQFVQAQIDPYDVVALMYPLTPTSGLTFTRDKFALGEAIERFEGRRGDYMPRNDLESNYAMEPPWRIEEIRSEVVGSALKGLAYHLGTLNEGRKSVIVVAETLSLTPSDLQEVVDAANRNNVAMYPIDAQGLSVGRPFGAFDVLQSLAESTTGRAISARNDLGDGLATVLRDSSAYYLLGYNSDKGADGKFHEIKVRVKKAGLEVRARKGYWAPTPAEAARALEPPRPGAPPAVTGALASLAHQRGSVIRTWIGMSRGDNGKTRVTFVWEPAPPEPGSEPGDRPGRVTLVASTVSGPTWFDGPVGDAVPEGRDAAATRTASVAPGPSRAVFDAPPGTLQMKLTVDAAPPGRDVLQSDTRTLVVADFNGPKPSISTPQVFAARSPREFRQFSSDPTAVPTVNRDFVRIERLLIRFEVYGPPVPPLAVAARLLNQHGDQMAPLTVQSVDQAVGQHLIDLPLATLPRGDYLIEVMATGQNGQARQLVAIRITG